MAEIKYDGTDDVRVLGADDLKRHSGVEGFRSTRFEKGKSTEVSDEVAEALLDKPEIFGKFSRAEEGDAEVETAEAEEPAPGEPTPSGATQESIPAAPRVSGRGAPRATTTPSA